jgi:hypothetical protein
MASIAGTLVGWVPPTRARYESILKFWQIIMPSVPLTASVLGILPVDQLHLFLKS